jgi:hypothetical protein
MFREVDIDHMKVHSVHLDDYQYVSDAAKQSRLAWLVKLCVLAGHSGPQSTASNRLLSQSASECAMAGGLRSSSKCADHCKVVFCLRYRLPVH